MIFFDSFQTIVPFFSLFFGISLLGFSCGIIGTILFLRKESMVADTIAHATFPGITGTFLVTHTRSPLLLFLGGILSGTLALITMIQLTRTTKLKKETILGTLLSVFFGFGFAIHSIIQKQQIEYQAVINKFLFGNAATLLFHEIIIIVFCSVVTLLLFFTQIRSITTVLFDPINAHICGYKKTQYDFFLFSLVIPIITLGLHIMGAILTGMLLIAPAAIARQWAKSMGAFTLLAGLIGTISTLSGTMISFWYEQIPTGPIIVVVMSIFLLISLLYNSRYT